MIEEEQKQEDSPDSELSMEDDEKLVDEELISFGLVEGRGTESALSVED